MITHKLTRDGYQERVIELEELKKLRPHALQEMVRMRELGDLSENAGYRASKRKLMQVDRRIQYLERLLSRSEVINTNSNAHIGLGSTVSVINEGGEHKTFTVVESHEADIAKQKISAHSPLGKTLLHKKVGDVADVVTQKGIKKYKIVNVS